MESLTEQQEDHLRKLINQAVQLPDLRTELLDHCCCRIEEEIESGMEFSLALKKCFEDLAPTGFSEIEEETIFLLTINKQLTMKKLLYLTGCCSASLFMIGILFKILHWPAANQVIGISNAFLLLTMLLMITIAARNYKYLKLNEKIRIFAGITGGIALSTGALFKLFYFPGANILMLCGILILALIFLPIFFWQMYQKEALAVGQSA